MDSDGDSMKLAVAGLGAIGLRVARAVDEGAVPGITLTSVSARDRQAAVKKVAGFSHVPEVRPLETLCEGADVVVECVPAAEFLKIATPAIDAGCVFMPLSVGQLLEHPGLSDRAAQRGARIVVPTGALIGLDTVRAMAVGEITQARLTTRKPPAGLAGAPHLENNGISLDGLTQPLKVFDGNALGAARGFPANVNVAAALALAGVGPQKTLVEIWADPTIDRNVQSVTVVSDSGEAAMTMNNIPSPDNPRTGRIVANSVIAALRRLTSPVVIGS